MSLPRAILHTLIVLLSYIAQSGRASYVIKLPMGSDECFILRAPAAPPSVMVRGSYDLLNDAAESNIFRAYVALVDEPHTILWKSDPDEQEGRFTVTVPAKARVEFCMDLDSTTDDDEVETEGLPVGFNLFLVTNSERTLDDGEQGPDAKRALQILTKAEDIYVDWKALLDHFDFLRNREAQHTLLTNQILSRVMSWTLIEAFLVVSMAVGQVLYWRKFFEQRRYL